MRITVSAALIVIASVFFCGFWWTYYFFPESVTIEGKSFNRGENGLWLRYLWYAGDAKYWASADSMIEHLKADQMRFACFHVRELKPDGQLALKYADRAKKLSDFIHEKAPGVKVIAWISLGSAYPARGIDLANETVRRNAVSEALWLTKECGFDGIQWDYEPCKSGDQGFLSLLKESRVALPAPLILSVATPACEQEGEATTWYSWSANYFEEVAEQVDQVAVMCYDMKLLFPWQYESAVRKQVPILSSAVAKSKHKCQVIFGLPVYTRNFIHDHCETLRLALRGVRAGISLPGVAPDSISGIALFADYTCTEKDWALYRKYWLCHQSLKTY